MIKYCCEKFKVQCLTDKALGLNIRIVKLSDEFVQRGQLSSNKSFMVTEGYADKITLDVKVMVINYCPFCGTELKKFYKSDEYAQEIMRP